MKGRTFKVIAALFAAVVMAGILALVVCRMGCRQAPSYERAFEARVRAEAPLPNRQTANVIDLPGLADRYPGFRRWLVQYMVRHDEDLDARGEVVYVTRGMRDETAVREMAEEIVKSFDANESRSNRERHLRLTVLQQLAYRGLVADWPVAQALELVQRAWPERGGWRRMLEAQAAHDPSAPSAWSPEDQRKLTARAKAVLEYADSQQPSKAAAE